MKQLDKFTVYGINHNELNLKEREEFVTNFRPYKKLKFLMEFNKIGDGILLSTCLRSEFYIWEEKENLNSYFNEIKGLFVKKGIEALEHLFKVTCGFDSVIPGEEQILAQIKKAYLDKLEKGKRPSPLNTIFNKAIALGKKFRSESKINENSVSVEALAIKESEKIFGDLKERNIFIIGAGEIASSLVKILDKKSCKNISVIKRRKSMIESQMDYFSFDDKIDLFKKADIVYSTTSAPHLILELEEVQDFLTKTRVLIDFAVPRDIDYRIGSRKNQILYNLEDLNALAGESYEKRLKICDENKEIIKLGIEKTLEWFHRRKL